MRRFWSLIAVVAIAFTGFASGVVVTLRYLAAAAPPVPPQPVPTTRLPAPQPLVAEGGEYEDSPCDSEIDPVADSENPSTDDLAAELAPSAAPIFVSDRSELGAGPSPDHNSPTNTPVPSVAFAADHRVAVFDVHERRAEEILPLIRLTRVTAAVDELTNKLVVSGTSEQLDAVAFLLNELDVRAPASDDSPRVADRSGSNDTVLRLYHWPSSQLPKLHARIAEMTGVQLASDGEIVAVYATPAQHRELEQLLQSHIIPDKAAPAVESSGVNKADNHAPKPTAASQTVASASIDTDAIAEGNDPRIVVTAAPVSDNQAEQPADAKADVPVAIASYRIASAYLAQDDLGEVAKKNKCVAALRKWLGRLAAGRFTANEVDACIQLLLGLGLIAPAENRQLAVNGDNGGVRFYVNQQGEVVESGSGGAQGIQQVLLRPATAGRLLVRLASANEEEGVSAEVGKAEAAVALVPSPKDDSNQPDVLLIVRPVPPHAAQSDSVTRR